MTRLTGSHSFEVEHSGTGVFFEGQVNYPTDMEKPAEDMAARVGLEVDRLTSREAETLLESERQRFDGSDTFEHERYPIKIRLFDAWVDAIAHKYQSVIHKGDNAVPGSVWFEMNVWQSRSARDEFFTDLANEGSRVSNNG
ncbi:hypothetical protein [uncultured Ruegeria sp.]|uniref:hypothetical protein n=1 Tax=uncultured Ruegeria sp. TaxID=259304 RepID=UPI002615AB07|nr:hypothetical protein [uncultured Ruegeria sp.]